MVKNMCMSMSKREREAQRGVMYISNSNSYNNNNNQPLLKVSKSLYIVTVLGQLPFMLFTEIAQTWTIQRDSVNTAIIHSYSKHAAQESDWLSMDLQSET